MSSWPLRTLGEASTQITVGFVGTMAEHYQPAGIPFLRSLNIKPFRLNLDDVKFIHGHFHARISKSSLAPGDVVVVRTGDPGTACVIPSSLPVSNCSDLVIIRPGPALNPHLLAAIFNSQFGRSLVGGNLVGAAQQHFNINVAKNIKLHLPPRPEQDRIAAILVAYDELIANNERRVALLDRMAEEMYREWFVRLRFPGPTEGPLVKGIPDGWTTRKLPEICDITYGFPFQANRFNDSGVGRPIIRIRNIPSATTSNFTDERADDKYIVRSGELLIGMDGDFHINRWLGDDAYLVQRSCRLRAKNPLYEAYVGHSIATPIKNLQQVIVGATVGHLGAKHLNDIDILVPAADRAAELQALNHLLQQRLVLGRINLRAGAMRDALLPRLISGKLSVEELDIRFPPSMATARECASELAKNLAESEQIR